MKNIVTWFKPRYEIKPEKMGGKMYWMIYFRFLWFSGFFERWNTLRSAEMRVKELNT